MVSPTKPEIVGKITIQYIGSKIKMVVQKNDEKYNQLYGRQPRCSELVSVNYCIPGTMSRCSAGLIWPEQKKCKYAVKSTVSDKCMHYIESLDGHCDSVYAQRGLNNKDQYHKD